MPAALLGLGRVRRYLLLGTEMSDTDPGRIADAELWWHVYGGSPNDGRWGRDAIEAAANALSDAHARLLLPDRVADLGWTVLAEIAVKTAAPFICPPDHLHYAIEFDSANPGTDGG